MILSAIPKCQKAVLYTNIHTVTQFVYSYRDQIYVEDMNMNRDQAMKENISQLIPRKMEDRSLPKRQKMMNRTFKEI